MTAPKRRRLMAAFHNSAQDGKTVSEILAIDSRNLDAELDRIKDVTSKLFLGGNP